ncbi:MAG: 50S ribosomal protein L29 [Verrucomicrobiae bacterium]|nr:50S ribosomal protein L29 [Verrucomicrobiae bacterium]
MKISELRALTPTELDAKGRDLRQELFNLRMRQAAGQLDQPSRLRLIRKDIARVETLLTELRRKATPSQP